MLVDSRTTSHGSLFMQAAQKLSVACTDMLRCAQQPGVSVRACRTREHASNLRNVGSDGWISRIPPQAQMVVAEAIQPSGEGFSQCSRQLDDLPTEFVHAGGSETFRGMHGHAATRTATGDKRKGVPYTRARVELGKFWTHSRIWIPGSGGHPRGDI